MVGSDGRWSIASMSGLPTRSCSDDHRMASELATTFFNQSRRCAFYFGLKARHKRATRKAGRDGRQEFDDDRALFFHKAHRAGPVQTRVQRHRMTGDVELSV